MLENAHVGLLAESITQNFPTSVYHENKILSLTWSISKSFCWIWVVNVLKSKFKQTIRI